MQTAAPSPELIAKLTAWFRRNGYVRLQNEERLTEPYGSYRKGDEVRLVAETPAERVAMEDALREAGFAPGKPFAKANQWRVPVYGRLEVIRFLVLIGEPLPKIVPTTPRRPRKVKPKPAAPPPPKKPRKRKVESPPARIIRVSSRGPIELPDFEGEVPS